MKVKRLLLVLLLLGLPVWAEYQQQGFDQFQAFDGNMEFVCTNQCIALIGPRQGSDYVQLQGSLQGQGVVGYGFLVGQQVIPGEMMQINGSAMLNQQFSFSTLPYIAQIPDEAQIVLWVEGNISGFQVRLDLGFWTLGQKIVKGWKEFWTFDTFKPYTINLLHGPKFLGKSANSIFYRIFLLIVLSIFIFTKHTLSKKIFYTMMLGLLLRGIYDLRMGLELINNYRNDYNSYISISGYQKIYRDRGDFYSFVDFTKNIFSQIGLSGTEKIIFYTDNTWPFPGSMKYFLYPYDVQINTGKSNYYIVYQTQQIQQKNNHLFYQDKDLGTGKTYQFSDNAFIFVK